jgi:hypothetical protein
MYPCACSQSNSHHKTAGQRLRAERAGRVRAGPWSESSGAPRTRSSLSRATPPHARTVSRAPAGSREPSPSRSVRSSSQRRCAAAPSSSSSKPGLSQKHERAAGQNCPGPAIDTQRKTTRLGPLGAEKAEIGPKNRDPDARTRLGAPDRVY